MNCEKIRAIILTGYLDREQCMEERDAVERHLAGCGACKEYASEVIKAVKEPFKEAEFHNPPDIIWSRIKKEISGEAAQGNRSLSFIHRLIPRPVFAFATVMVIALFLGVFTKFYMNREEIAFVTTDTQPEYFAYLSIDSSALSNGEVKGYGTVIEEYFL